MSLALDLVRVVAALAVLAAHTAQTGVYLGAWPFSELFQHMAVIVFFVLSGLVIAQATLSRPTSLRDYAIARLTRIVPVLIPAVLVGLAVMALAWKLGIDEVTAPMLKDRIDDPGAPLPLLWLSQLFSGYGPAWDPPIWSLSYEIWYYAFFAAMVFCRRSIRPFVGILIALAAGPRIVLLAPVWLSGVWLARQGGRFRLTIGEGLAALGIATLVGFVICETAIDLAKVVTDRTGIGAGPLRFSGLFVSDWALIPVLLVGFVGLRPVAEASAPWLQRHAGAIRSLAGASFTLYLMHWPVLSLLRIAGFAVASPVALVVVLGVLQWGAMGLSRLTEARRYALRAALERRLAGTVMPATA